MANQPADDPRRFRIDVDHRGDRTGNGATERIPVTLPLGRIADGSILAVTVRNNQGGTLLAPGSRLNRPLLNRLQSNWGIREVTIWREIESRASHVPPPTRQTRAALFRREVDEFLREHIDRAFHFGHNRGKPVRDEVLPPLGQDYPSQLLDDVAQTHRAIQILVPHWLRRLSEGIHFDVEPLSKLIDRYRQLLVADMDAALTVPVPEPLSIAGRSCRLAIVAMSIGIQIGLDADNIRRVGLGGVLHDWGWHTLPSRLLTLRGPHSDADRLEISKHPTLTRSLLEQIENLPPVIHRLVLQVHERLDGGGYPQGIGGTSLLFLSRVLNVADEYLGLIDGRDRPAPASGYRAMVTILELAAQKSLDSLVVRGLLRAMSLFALGSRVILSDGQQATVWRTNGDFYNSPIVRIDSVDGQPRYLNLIDDPLTVASEWGSAQAPTGTTAHGPQPGVDRPHYAAGGTIDPDASPTATGQSSRV